MEINEAVIMARHELKAEKDYYISFCVQRLSVRESAKIQAKLVKIKSFEIYNSCKYKCVRTKSIFENLPRSSWRDLTARRCQS